MTEKKKRGRPHTLDEHPFSMRFPPGMLEAMRAAARREGLAMAAWLREAIRARLPK